MHQIVPLQLPINWNSKQIQSLYEHDINLNIVSRIMVDSTCNSVSEQRFWFSVHLLALQRLPYKYDCNSITACYKYCGKDMQNIKRRCICLHWCMHLSPINYHETKMSNCYNHRKIKTLMVTSGSYVPGTRNKSCSAAIFCIQQLPHLQWDISSINYYYYYWSDTFKTVL